MGWQGTEAKVRNRFQGGKNWAAALDAIWFGQFVSMKIAFLAALLLGTSGIFAGDDWTKRRTAEYDYEAPAAGTYELPILQAATDGTVLGTNGAPVKLRELMRGR